MYGFSSYPKTESPGCLIACVCCVCEGEGEIVNYRTCVTSESPNELWTRVKCHHTSKFIICKYSVPILICFTQHLHKIHRQKRVGLGRSIHHN